MTYGLVSLGGGAGVVNKVPPSPASPYRSVRWGLASYGIHCYPCPPRPHKPIYGFCNNNSNPMASLRECIWGSHWAVFHGYGLLTSHPTWLVNYVTSLPLQKFPAFFGLAIFFRKDRSTQMSQLNSGHKLRNFATSSKLILSCNPHLDVPRAWDPHICVRPALFSIRHTGTTFVSVRPSCTLLYTSHRYHPVF
jgi:hypothetical protein